MSGFLESVKLTAVTTAFGVSADATASAGYSKDAIINDVAQPTATGLGWLAIAVPGAASIAAATANLAALVTDIIVFGDDVNASPAPTTQPLSVIADIGQGVGDILGFYAAMGNLPIAAMARVLGVSEASCHAWRHRPSSAHALADAVLLKQVRIVHASSREAYDVPRIHAEIRAGGKMHARKRIARLMRLAGLVGASRRRATIPGIISSARQHWASAAR